MADRDRLHVDRYPPDRREQGIHRNNADDALADGTVRPQVAPAYLDGQLEGQTALGSDGGQVQVRVQNLNLVVGLESRRSDLGSAADVDPQGDRLVTVGAQLDILQVQDNVSDILHHPFDSAELVQGVVELHLGDRSARDRRQQRPPERVAQGVAEARLKRADGKLLTVADGFADGFDGRSLNDQHGVSFSPSYLRGYVTVPGPEEPGTTWNRARQ